MARKRVPVANVKAGVRLGLEMALAVAETKVTQWDREQADGTNDGFYAAIDIADGIRAKIAILDPGSPHPMLLQPPSLQDGILAERARGDGE